MSAKVLLMLALFGPIIVLAAGYGLNVREGNSRKAKTPDRCPTSRAANRA